MTTECAYQISNILGEGPVWCPLEQALYWVDIDGFLLQRWHPESEDYQSWPMPTHIGCFALREGGGGIVALRTGFASIDFDGGTLTPLFDPEADQPDMRFNDGKCDRKGRFWAGTQEDGLRAARGSLYRFSANHNCQKMRGEVICSNGIGWSPDNRTMYYTDSMKYEIYAYDFDPDSGEIENERIFAKDIDCIPDGLTVDAEGCVWSAKWDGWKVVRYTPDGKVDSEITMPVQRPTSCMFGGPDLNLLYVTSASIGLSENDLQNGPLAGSVFVIETDTKGLPEPRFAG